MLMIALKSRETELVIALKSREIESQCRETDSSSFLLHRSNNKLISLIFKI